MISARRHLLTVLSILRSQKRLNPIFFVFDESLQRNVYSLIQTNGVCFSPLHLDTNSFLFFSFASLPERRIMAFIIICMHLKTSSFFLSPSVLLHSFNFYLKAFRKTYFNSFEPFAMKFCNQWYFRDMIHWIYVYVFMWLWLSGIFLDSAMLYAIQLLSELIITSLNMWNY